MTFKEFFNEWLLTFSAKKSLFSSIKIERFISFKNANIIIMVYFFMRMFGLGYADKVPVEVIGVLVSMLLGYGAWNTVQGRKNKEVDNKEQEPKQE